MSIMTSKPPMVPECSMDGYQSLFVNFFKTAIYEVNYWWEEEWFRQFVWLYIEKCINTRHPIEKIARKPFWGLDDVYNIASQWGHDTPNPNDSSG
jgi:hypothetical protein